MLYKLQIKPYMLEGTMIAVFSAKEAIVGMFIYYTNSFNYILIN